MTICSTCVEQGKTESQPECCMRLASTCIQLTDDVKCREWTHISVKEHVCLECVEFLSTQDEAYPEWKARWEPDALSPPKVLTYITEKLLPFWLQCSSCRKWRRVQDSHLRGDKIIDSDISSETVIKYTCADGHLVLVTSQQEGENGEVKTFSKTKLSRECNAPQEKIIGDVDSSHFVRSITYPPLLKFSPAEQLLKGYYPDGIGQSIIDSNRKYESIDDDNNRGTPKKRTPRKVSRNRFFPTRKARKDSVNANIPFCGACRHIKPFYQPGDAPAALTLRPDSFEPDEASAFQDLPPATQRLVLALRNLIISLWSLTPTQILTPATCFDHTLIRGLVRVAVPQLIERILEFLTVRGLVNFGLIDDIPRPLVKLSKAEKIIVVGAGPAGIACARQLHNFGFEVSILEARDRLGGRVYDVPWKSRVAAGAMIINGCQNNPIAIMSHQVDESLHVLGSQCDLFIKHEAIPRIPDVKMEYHFNNILDILSDWRSIIKEDIPLSEAIQMAHKEYVAQSSERYSKMEMKLLDFHISNLEYACGSSLANVSALNWDQNEKYPQFQGDHTIVTYGFSDVLERLARPLDIQYKSPVKLIRHSDDKVEIEKIDGSKVTADRCVVTVPLALLKKNCISFSPGLSERKRDAIARLGAGLIEKILLRYDTKWWSYKIGGADFFGSIEMTGSDSGVDAEDEQEPSGLFNVFYDIPSPDNQQNTLLSIVSGPGLPVYESMSDKELVEAAHHSLQEIFKEIELPKPVDYYVSRWGRDQYSQMSYSYVQIGADGRDYDAMAKPESDRLMFAGEATNRHFPQTVTGAYLSGLREASRIFTLANPKSEADIKQEAAEIKKRKSTELSDGAAFGPNKSRRRSDRSKHVTSYVELDEDFMLD